MSAWSEICPASSVVVTGATRASVSAVSMWKADPAPAACTQPCPDRGGASGPDRPACPRREGDALLAGPGQRRGAAARGPSPGRRRPRGGGGTGARACLPADEGASGPDAPACVNRIRIDRAAALLARGEAPPADIAAGSGLAHLSHVHRLFRAHSGLTRGRPVSGTGTRPSDGRTRFYCGTMISRRSLSGSICAIAASATGSCTTMSM